MSAPSQNPRNAEAPPSFEANQAKEQLRFSPHMILLRQYDRLQEVMSAGADPMPAFITLRSALLAIGAEDERFQREMRDTAREIRAVFRQRGSISALTYVSRYLVPMVGLMVRCDILEMPRKPPTTERGPQIPDVPSWRRRA